MLLGVSLGILQVFQVPFGLQRLSQAEEDKILNAACVNSQRFFFASLTKACANYTTDQENTAVIVETREHEMLSYVVANVASNLPDWTLYLFHTDENSQYVRNLPVLKKLQKLRRLRLLSLGNLTKLFHGVSSIRAFYNCLLRSPAFWSCSSAKNILLFQTDSVLCGGSTYQIEDFLSYDYIGAPWANGGVGNGGLSLRRREKMLELTRTRGRWLHIEPESEDLFFTQAGVKSQRFRLAPLEEAQRFSTDAVYNESVGTSAKEEKFCHVLAW